MERNEGWAKWIGISEGREGLMERPAEYQSLQRGLGKVSRVVSMEQSNAES